MKYSDLAMMLLHGRIATLVVRRHPTKLRALFAVTLTNTGLVFCRPPTL